MLATAVTVILNTIEVKMYIIKLYMY